MEITRELIAENINDPKVLEDLYQSNKKAFSEIIKTMYGQEPDLIIEYWYMRLFYKPSNKKNNTQKYLFTAFLIIVAWLPLRLLLVDFSDRNIFLLKAIPIVFSLTLSLFFLFNSIKIKNIVLSIVPHVIMYIYLILLPDNNDSHHCFY